MSTMEETRPATRATGTMNVPDKTGHTKVEWDKNVAGEVELAKAAYDAAIAKGYQAFAVRTDGTQGRRLTTFDASAEEIMMVPRLQGG
jgi:hypothetical protein